MKRLTCLVVICSFCSAINSPRALAYCSASGGCDEYIYSVSIGDIYTWATPCSGYIDYSGTQSTAMEPGQSYSFEVVTATPSGGPYTGYGGDKLGIWIDFNGDGVFAHPDDLVYSLDDYGYFSGIINVPANANGGVTKMRIRLTYLVDLNPCLSDTYGEVEDYGIILPSVPQTRIHGRKWHDLNDNGEMDTGEPGLSGWTIFLDENYNGEIDPNDVVTTTDGQGNYEFNGIEPGQYYYVSEQDEPGWINTYPGAGGIHYRTRVEEGNDIELNFGNYQLHNCDISGYKFHDVNNNGVWDADEGALSGWEIYIDENENGRWDSGEPKTTTNANGYYEFTNLEPGYYNIMEVPQTGWFQTYPGLTSGRLWGLEGGGGSEASMIAEVNLATMSIESRFAAPYESPIIGIGCLAAGPSTLFYCPFRLTGVDSVENLIFEIDSETGLVLYEGVLDMPENEVGWGCAWHKGVLYVLSLEVPISNNVAYLNRYDASTKELISRDLLVEGAGDDLANDPYENVLLSNLAVQWTLFEIDPNTAGVVGKIAQQLPVRSSVAYTQGVLYKTHSHMEEMTVTHRYDGSILSIETLDGYTGFDTLAGGIGTRGGHRIWIGKSDIEVNFGGRIDSGGSLSGTKYEDLNGNGQQDANEPGIADWPIYIDLDGDMHPDPQEPMTVTNANGDWVIDGLAYGRYFVREVQQKGYKCTEPKLGWIDTIDVNRPRDIIFDDLRNLIYIGTEAGTIERFDIGTSQFLSPVSVGGSPHGMDITADYSALYVADTQLSDSNGLVHKVNLNTINVTDCILSQSGNSSYDIAIGSEGIALVTAHSNGGGSVPLYALDTSTDSIITRPDVLGKTTIENDVRLVRSYDRSTIWLTGNNYIGWIAAYDAPSDTFTAEKEFNDFLNASPAALNRNGSIGAIQLDEHCRLVDSDFNMVMGLDDSKIAAEFDPSADTFYQFRYEGGTLFAIDTTAWDVSDYIRTSTAKDMYERFFRGETAITADGRVLGVTDPNYITLYRKEHYAMALPGRNISGINFGNMTLMCGDIDGDRDVDIYDLSRLCEDWLCSEISMDVAPAVRDYFVNMQDLARFAKAWRSQPGDADWDAICDAVPAGGDGEVDINELKTLANEWLLKGMIYDSDVAGADGPDGYVNMIDLACLADNWGIAHNIIKYDEDFETGDFSNLPWEHDGDEPWIIVSTEQFEGNYSAMSAYDLPWYDESILRVTTTCGNGNIHFMLKNGGGGVFRFIVDGELVFDQDLGNWEVLDWFLVTIPVSAGTHTFEWYYRPDGFGEEKAWIDAIRLPPAADE